MSEVNEIRAAAASIVSDGVVRLTIATDLARRISRVLDEARGFFGQAMDKKRIHATADLLNGYRPAGSEFSVRSEMPDLSESFVCRPRNGFANPMFRSECSLHSALQGLAHPYLAVANQIMNALRSSINPNGMHVDIWDTSYLQVNHYKPALEEREFLQEAHEDGELLTIVCADAEGLEVLQAGRYVPVEFQEGQVLVMPGLVMSLLTGGVIQPLYHRVRCAQHVRARTSLMLFINPSVEKSIIPWKMTPENVDVDIRRIAIEKSRAYGLPSFY